MRIQAFPMFLSYIVGNLSRRSTCINDNLCIETFFYQGLGGINDAGIMVHAGHKNILPTISYRENSNFEVIIIPNVRDAIPLYPFAAYSSRTAPVFPGSIVHVPSPSWLLVSTNGILVQVTNILRPVRAPFKDSCLMANQPHYCAFL